MVRLRKRAEMLFIEPHSAANFFGRDRLYGYWDDAERFAFFSKAAVEFMSRANKRPDIVHCHDWQTGLVPVLLHEQYAGVMPGQKTCYTIRAGWPRWIGMRYGIGGGLNSGVISVNE